VGYAYLIARESLTALPLDQTAAIDTAVKGRTRVNRGDQVVLQFESKYRPAPTLRTHVQFALRYEGINLQVLALLFAAVGGEEVDAWLADRPESAYARCTAFLYEWLTGNTLTASANAKTAFVPVLNPKLQFEFAHGTRNAKFRVIDNLPGTPSFCPLVRKTPFLEEMQAKGLHDHIAAMLRRYDPDLLRRAAAYLYLKETHSSFEVEREHPSPSRAQRFADLLREAQSGTPLNEERLVELQNAVVDPRFREAGYRVTQNWVGDDLGYRKRWRSAPRRRTSPLTEGTGFGRTPAPAPTAPTVAAPGARFRFCLHPFLDGNGRLHRYLIHEALAAAGFTPQGVILPVSAVILAELQRYEEVLRHFSQAVMERTEYVPDGAAAQGNDAVYFRYFDATEQAQYLYHALDRTVSHDLPQEIDFLLGFDRARAVLNTLADWPAHSADLFIRVVHQNKGRLSAAKRESHFSWMSASEIAAAEAAVVDAFAPPDAAAPSDA
jgi:hypothetical protein